ncbi:MAG: hypothetical protein ACYTFI_14525 [Planctomycetota bacterium]
MLPSRLMATRPRPRATPGALGYLFDPLGLSSNHLSATPLWKPVEIRSV